MHKGSKITQKWRDNHPQMDEIDPETCEIITLDELGQLSPGQRQAVIRRQHQRFDSSGNDAVLWPEETHDPD